MFSAAFHEPSGKKRGAVRYATMNKNKAIEGHM
jgi:hypothetical protein